MCMAIVSNNVSFLNPFRHRASLMVNLRFSLFRNLVGWIILILFVGTLTFTPSQAFAAGPKDRAVLFMKHVTKKLLKAVRSGSKDKLRQIILSYADLQGIGMYSLGNYARKLPRSRRSLYYQGVAKFMARYMMEQYHQHRIKHAKIDTQSFSEGKTVLIDSIVYLKDGSSYEVQWRLTPYNRTFKIRDVKVLGLWLVPFQRNLFNEFIDGQNGNVNTLVIALNYN